MPPPYEHWWPPDMSLLCHDYEDDCCDDDDMEMRAVEIVVAGATVAAADGVYSNQSFYRKSD